MEKEGWKGERNETNQNKICSVININSVSDCLVIKAHGPDFRKILRQTYEKLTKQSDLRKT